MSFIFVAIFRLFQVDVIYQYKQYPQIGEEGEEEFVREVRPALTAAATDKSASLDARTEVNIPTHTILTSEGTLRQRKLSLSLEFGN